MVGYCYYWGYEVTEDLAKAFEWFRKSAEQGKLYAQDYLGYCYQYGYGVPENMDTAVDWYRKSADQGFRDAIDILKELDKSP
ncbi:Sel1 repeat family protein [Polychytrium aggregatum]|uniref:Sel1 repeat family protein n=1 Tax=Polychytrium aggregatum TaxID=110093 RepID=UPI0022FDB1F8|nr:Sel1 repeat family protein [Polychytrium aggregatum]KAI9209526.1 Sel1 repeat family protein [Polychytrium aggregatum]